MIIIETKTGPHMINERETIGCSFDKAKGEAIVTYNRDPREVVSFHEGIPLSKKEYPSVTFTDVEDVIYVTDQNSGSYRYQGSEIERLQDQVKKNVTELVDSISHRSKQERIIEEYAFFLRRIRPFLDFKQGKAEKLCECLLDEIILIDKKMRKLIPNFDIYYGRITGNQESHREDGDTYRP